MAVSPTGSHVALVNDKGLLQLWDVAKDSCTKTFPESQTCTKRRGLLRFSPDGRRLVTCDDRGHAHVWEIASGQLAFTLNYPEGDIANVFFGRDGLSLITSNHREVVVWDLKPDRPLPDLWDSLGHEAPEAEKARRALLAEPVKAIELLRNRLRRAKALDASEVRRNIELLDHKDFRSRERAVAELISQGRRVVPFLKDAKATTDEGIARLAVVVRTLEAGLTVGELRQVRAIEVLEQIHSPAAQKLIDMLSEGDPGAALTIEAKKTSTKTAIARSRSARDRPSGAKNPTGRSATTPAPTGTGGWSPSITSRTS